MVIHFYIRYASMPGESLHLRIYDKRMQDEATLDMQFLNAEYWHIAIGEEDLLTANILLYDCELRKDGESVRALFAARRIDIRKIHVKTLELYDEIENADYLGEIFEKTAFRVMGQPKNKSAKKNADKNYTVAFNAFAPALPPGKVLCIAGTGKKLKNWDAEKPMLLYRKGGHWSVKLNLSSEKSIAFKYGVYDTELKQIVEWEDGENRVLHTPGKNTVTVLHQYARIHQQNWKGAALAVPLRSVRTDGDWGVGDFSSITGLADVAKSMGFKMLQFLPLLDTTATRTRNDSYPYAPVSAFALHPLFLNVEKLARQAGIEIPEAILLKIESANRSANIRYDEVLEVKEAVMRLIFEEEQFNFRDDYDWFAFFDLNRDWLVPYAVFCFLRDKFGTTDFNKWDEFSTYNEEKVTELASPHSEHYSDISFYYFLQYHLHLQLTDACEYAKKKEVLLKGDLPVGVARFSVETWMYPQYFNMEMDYGAPPDAFSDTGQNWGFPTYNWDALKTDNYSWWRRRMEHMSNYFQAVRIDHVIGLMRMFSIPNQSGNSRLGYFVPAIPLSEEMLQQEGIDANVRGLIADNNNADGIFIRVGSGLHFRIGMQGTEKFGGLPSHLQQKLTRLYERFFYETQSDLWNKEGEEKLLMLKQASGMLLCAEDLGMVPPSLPALLERLRILALRVERMPNAMNERYANPEQAPYLSVATTGTHDMPTLREWWEADRENIQYYYNHILGHHGLAPFFCEAWIVREIIQRHLQSPAMWVALPLQDVLGMHEGLRRNNPAEERINDPASAGHVWDFRVHLTVDYLADQKQFIEHVAELISGSGR